MLAIENTLFKFFFFIAGFFFIACGLEDVITVYEPLVTNNNPLYSNDDFLTWYCDFETNEKNQPDSFIGTNVYYKIYNNYESLNSQKSSILALNTNNNASAAAVKMIDSLGFGYQQLGASSSSNSSVNQTVFIPSAGSSRKVRFRLKTYKGMESVSESENHDLYSYRSCIELFSSENSDFLKESDGVRYMIPLRNGNRKSFDFFDDDDDDNNARDVLPNDGDNDYYHSESSSESDTYYVQLFAVGVAFNNETLSNSYSLVLDLGSIPIKKGQ